MSSMSREYRSKLGCFVVDLVARPLLLACGDQDVAGEVPDGEAFKSFEEDLESVILRDGSEVVKVIVEEEGFEL